MNIITLISWFDEKPDWLAASVASAAPFTDHFIAVDGAYMLYPGGKPRSPTGQAEAIREAARACNCGCTVHEPTLRWGGNEVEKRAFMFALGGAVARDENDWFFILDGDEVVEQVGLDVRATLAETDKDVGEVLHWEYREHVPPEQRPFVTDMEVQRGFRKFFRACRGLTVAGNHYTYVSADGRRLWGQQGDLAEPEDMKQIRVEHRNKSRDLWRADAASKYYERRDRLEVEAAAP